MSDNDWDDDERESGSGLRKQLEDALARVKDAEARAAAAEKNLAERDLSTFLRDRNLNPKIGKFILADKVDVSDTTALDAWLSENGDVFGAAAPAEGGGAGDGEGDDPPAVTERHIPEVPDEIEDGFRRLQALKGSAPAPARSIEELKRSLPKDFSGADVLERAAELGL